MYSVRSARAYRCRQNKKVTSGKRQIVNRLVQVPKVGALIQDASGSQIDQKDSIGCSHIGQTCCCCHRLRYAAHIDLVHDARHGRIGDVNDGQPRQPIGNGDKVA